MSTSGRPPVFYLGGDTPPFPLQSRLLSVPLLLLLPCRRFACRKSPLPWMTRVCPTCRMAPFKIEPPSPPKKAGAVPLIPDLIPCLFFLSPDFSRLLRCGLVHRFIFFLSRSKHFCISPQTPAFCPLLAQVLFLLV